MKRLAVTALTIGLLFAAPAYAAEGPRYDVPHGFTRCSRAVAWHGFFKWASAKDASCHETQRFMRAYAEKAGGDFFHNGGKHWNSQNDPEWLTLKACVLGETKTGSGQ